MDDAEVRDTENLRLKARRQIVQTANRHIVRKRMLCRFNPGPMVEAPLSMRHIQRAVRIVRQHLLVDDELLELAGYNGVSRHG